LQNNQNFTPKINNKVKLLRGVSVNDPKIEFFTAITVGHYHFMLKNSHTESEIVTPSNNVVLVGM